MNATGRTDQRVQSTYINHAGDELPQIEITRYIHIVDGDTYAAPGNIRVLYTVRGRDEKFMAFAEAYRNDAAAPFWTGNSLWNHDRLPLSDLERIIDGVTGMHGLKRNFGA